MEKMLKKAAIVIPHCGESLTREQEISFEHLEKHLPFYDRFLVIPGDSDFTRPGYKIKKFHSEYFRSKKTYNALVLSREFYEQFTKYEYILIFQPDCLVFRDELLTWCEKGYDYIGAPWFKRVESTRMWWSRSDCVGNGGFSLRKVSAFLEFADRLQGCKVRQFVMYFRVREFLHFIMGVFQMPLPRIILKVRDKSSMFFRNSFKSFKKRPSNFKIRGQEQEDVMIYKFAASLIPDFRIAPLEEALKFAWETEPRYCYEKNKHQLPFGCHAWERHDRAFWEKHLLMKPLQSPSPLPELCKSV